MLLKEKLVKAVAALPKVFTFGISFVVVIALEGVAFPDHPISG